MEIPSEEEEHKVAENAVALQEVTSNYNEDDEGDSHVEKNSEDYFDHTLLEVTQSSTEPTPSKPAVRKSQRTKNFTIKEDILLCKAWLNISLDSGHNNEQNKKPYWSRIYEYFQKQKDFESDRSIKSLTTRWGVIHQAVIRFTECYSEIQHTKQDDNTKLNEINDAKELYYSLYKGFFKFEYCWNVLKDEPKWIVLTTEKKRLKSSNNNSPGASSSINIDEDNSQTQTSIAVTIETPLEKRKAEKETPRRKKKRVIEENDSQTQTSELSKKTEKETPRQEINEALIEENLSSQKSLNNIEQVKSVIPFEKEKDEREKEREREDEIREEEIMKLDLRNMAPHQVKYWTKKQMDILQKHNLL